MTPLERAARAIAIASDVETEARASIGQEPFVQPNHLKIARAVLTAIREPSEGMIAMARWRQSSPNLSEAAVATYNWQEMIDAALSEGETE